MTQITLYHNPRCSKSRQALALLQEQGLEPTLRLYLDEAPSISELERLLTLLNTSPREIIRGNDALYQELGLDQPLSDAELLRQLAAHPSLLQRPIAVSGQRAVIARPPELVLEILS